MNSPLEQRSAPSGGLRLVARSLVARLLAGVFLTATTADAGTLTGRVLEAGSGNYLQGAEIALDGSVLRTTTERDGSFVLNNVPAGTYSVTATYTGLEPVSLPV